MYLNVLFLSDLEKGSLETGKKKASRETVLGLNLTLQFAGWVNLCTR